MVSFLQKKHQTELRPAFRNITHVTHTKKGGPPDLQRHSGSCKQVAKRDSEGWKVAEDTGTLESFQWPQTLVKTFDEDEPETCLFPSPCLQVVLVVE